MHADAVETDKWMTDEGRLSPFAPPGLLADETRPRANRTGDGVVYRSEAAGIAAIAGAGDREFDEAEGFLRGAKLLPRSW